LFGEIYNKISINKWNMNTMKKIQKILCNKNDSDIIERTNIVDDYWQKIYDILCNSNIDKYKIYKKNVLHNIVIKWIYHKEYPLLAFFTIIIWNCDYLNYLKLKKKNKQNIKYNDYYDKEWKIIIDYINEKNNYDNIINELMYFIECVCFCFNNGYVNNI
jgi:hypothetical protein